MKDQSMIQFGKSLRKKRIDLDISREVLAKMTGLSVSYLGHLEQGEINPTIRTLARNARAMDEQSIVTQVFPS